MAHPFIKITLQQGKQKMQPLPRGKITYADLNNHHSINVMNTCPHAATETKRYRITIEQSIEIYRHTYYADL